MEESSGEAGGVGVLVLVVLELWFHHVWGLPGTVCPGGPRDKHLTPVLFAQVPLKNKLVSCPLPPESKLFYFHLSLFSCLDVKYKLTQMVKRNTGMIVAYSMPGTVL